MKCDVVFVVSKLMYGFIAYFISLKKTLSRQNVGGGVYEFNVSFFLRFQGWTI